MVFCYQNCSVLRKKCSSDREKLLKFEAEGREVSKFLQILSLQPQISKVFLTVGQNNFGNKIPLLVKSFWFLNFVFFLYVGCCSKAYGRHDCFRNGTN